MSNAHRASAASSRLTSPHDKLYIKSCFFCVKAVSHAKRAPEIMGYLHAPTSTLSCGTPAQPSGAQGHTANFHAQKEITGTNVSCKCHLQGRSALLYYIECFSERQFSKWDFQGGVLTILYKQFDKSVIDCVPEILPEIYFLTLCQVF